MHSLASLDAIAIIREGIGTLSTANDPQLFAAEHFNDGGVAATINVLDGLGASSTSKCPMELSCTAPRVKGRVKRCDVK